jgi:hypothetical protein
VNRLRKVKATLRADAQRVGFGVGDLDGAAPATVDVDDGLNHRRDGE